MGTLLKTKPGVPHSTSFIDMEASHLPDNREPSNSKEVKDLRRRIFSGRRKFSRRLLAETEKKGKRKEKKGEEEEEERR